VNNITKYVGMDVSKDKIAVSVADSGRGPARYWGVIPNDIKSIKKLIYRLGEVSQLHVCDEVGPLGYVLFKQLREMGVYCEVIAPSLTPQEPGNRVKTDRRDAVRLAELLPAGELTPVWVPREEDEILRDLVRAREDAKEDLLRAKHRLEKFLLRHGIRKPADIRSWSTKYRTWLKHLEFKSEVLQTVFDEYRQNIVEIEERIYRLESEIHKQAEESAHAPLIKALQTLRGIKEVSATTIVAEVGYFSRFQKPTQLMSYSGLVPSEYSSGSKRHKAR